LTQKVQKEEDDVIKEHIYEPIRHILASLILKNAKNKFKAYRDKIGKKVSLSVSMKMRSFFHDHISHVFFSIEWCIWNNL